MDLESLVNLITATMFLAAMIFLFHPKVGGNSLKKYLVIVAMASFLNFVVSAWPLLIETATPDLVFVYWAVVVRTITKVFIPASFLLLAYKAVRYNAQKEG